MSGLTQQEHDRLIAHLRERGCVCEPDIVAADRASHTVVTAHDHWCPLADAGDSETAL